MPLQGVVINSCVSVIPNAITICHNGIISNKTNFASKVTDIVVNYNIVVV